MNFHPNITSTLAAVALVGSVLAVQALMSDQSGPVAAPAAATPAAGQVLRTALASDAGQAASELDQAFELDATNAVDNHGQVGALSDDRLDTPLGDNDSYPTLRYRLAEMQARRDGKAFNPDDVVAAMAEPAAWQQDDTVADQLAVSDEERYDGRSFIRFKPLKVETLMPGDVLAMPIPQENREYQMQVDRVEVHDDGSVSWYGQLKDFDGMNDVNITQADGVTQMGVFTPDRHYIVEVFDNAGWVVDANTLFRGEDVLIPVEDGIEGEPIVHNSHDQYSFHEGHH